MERKIIIAGVILWATLAIVHPQVVPARFVGAVTGFNPEAAEIQVKPDSGDPVAVKLSPTTIVQRIAPGEKDLKKAETIPLTSIAKGDRVLVNLTPGSVDAVRIVVMSATDIAKRNEADKLDWSRRGVAGVVASKKDGQITVRMRSLTGETTALVTVNDNTRFRRYAPDSVRFADAKPSSLGEVARGDQLRARGSKSGDGLTVAAEEVVFGSFETRAGSITAVDAGTNRITIKDLTTDKPLTIVVAPDSQLKRMPGFPSGGAGGGPPAGGPGMTPGRPGLFGGHGGGPPDLAQMLERMPGATLADLKPGEMILVSSTKGTKPGEITAITLLANANFLIQMATAQASRQRPAGDGGLGMNGMGMTGTSGFGGARPARHDPLIRHLIEQQTTL